MPSSPPKRPSLTAGLNALKQKDYDRAIAHLQGVCDREPESSRTERARMGLAMTYRELGQVERAIALCQGLVESSNPNLQNLAVQTLKELSEPIPAPVISDETIQFEIPPEFRKQTDEEEKGPGFRQWRQAPGAKRWNSLPKTGEVGSDLRWLWGAQVVVAIAFFYWSAIVIKVAGLLVHQLLLVLPWVSPWRGLSADPTLALLILFSIILLGSPWILSALLKRSYQLAPLTLENLQAIRPESATAIQRFCRQRKLPQPTLGILPTTTPVIFTYGNLPQTARIIISQGTIDCLNDEELAALYVTQLSQIVHWDFVLLSVSVCVLQLPYTCYWSIAKWGEKLSDRIEVPALEFLLWHSSLLLANLSYTFDRLLRWPLLLLSRWRLLYSDRAATSITGNPNALTRALLKLGEAWHQCIARTSVTPELIERFDLLLPLSWEQGVAIGNIPASEPLETLFQWDLHNPYRYGLSLGSSHGLLGDRLQRLADYARFFRIETELDLPSMRSHRPSMPANIPDGLKRLFVLVRVTWRAISRGLPLLPSALLQSTIGAVGLRLLLALTGAIAYFLYIGQLVWLMEDRYGDLMQACWFMAFSIIVMIRLNGYYPEVKPTKSRSQTNSSWETVQALAVDPQGTPSDRPILRLQGKLLGRRGVRNGLGQNLILQTRDKLMILRHCPSASIFGDVGVNVVSPKDSIGQSVSVGGWFRRTHTSMLDLSYLQGRSPIPSWSYHPIVLAAIAIVCGLRAAYLIWQT
ncbi:zinc metalloprotease HtpX [Roseofilum casamattae]|uniref:Zinc metalloprotease HtpX n=1 Tax=Roseofilum casamattae BLCC-M143 TaxID=3022442 RepID=A0ABT7BWA4_9CYAN|nr:zinc metalloprotease HtpX [Roseofilum casamattae]MDJ1182543.1 zinc metalloprotease HtpX [Roseofilum casamattae BLCC-M143]